MNFAETGGHPVSHPVLMAPSWEIQDTHVVWHGITGFSRGGGESAGEQQLLVAVQAQQSIFSLEYLSEVSMVLSKRVEWEGKEEVHKAPHSLPQAKAGLT